MHNLFLGAAAATLLLITPVAIADAAPSSVRLYDGVYEDGNQPTLENVSLYISGGRNYCWYYSGWDGPGYYWCGYAWRSGFGWGGGLGWNGWQGGHSGSRSVSSAHGSGARVASSRSAHVSSTRVASRSSGGGHSSGGGGHSSGGSDSHKK
jgi:hypothetical protein